MLADVRQAVVAVRGVGARSVRVHGVTVLLDMRSDAQQVTPESKTTQGQPSGGAATTRKRDDELTSKQRRSRRRLRMRIHQRAQDERFAQSQGDDMETSSVWDTVSNERLAENASGRQNNPSIEFIEAQPQGKSLCARRRKKGPSTDKADGQLARVATSGPSGGVRGGEVGGYKPRQTWPTPSESKCAGDAKTDDPRVHPAERRSPPGATDAEPG